ncbi:TPA: competence protein ComGG [Streptococcus suis]|nr:competence protein ComGG [Streptococcus suis]HEM3974055.1 competence protein ComGG [Streptococcus suis]HEM3978225.1 competence protein ComGG [Streptococcus suis]HEO8617547.1 competence protein ComGG [Streptococcus suis]
MLLKKKVKAGILLYALLMLAVFSILLQFYLHRQEAESQIAQLAKQEATAYIMAQMVLDQVEQDLQERQAVAKEEVGQTDEKEVKEEQPTRVSQENVEKPAQMSSKKKEESKPIVTEGSMLFREGQASYHIKNRTVSVNVDLRNGGKYHYQFPVKIVPEGSG